MKLTRLLLLAHLTTFAFAPIAQADSNYKVKFNYNVTLSVGESAIVHATRGRCGRLPSKSTLARHKKKIDRRLKTGHITFGKEGIRKSNACEGWTPVYETIFVADRVGKETIEIHGNLVYIEVK